MKYSEFFSFFLSWVVPSRSRSYECKCDNDASTSITLERRDDNSREHKQQKSQIEEKRKKDTMDKKNTVVMVLVWWEPFPLSMSSLFPHFISLPLFTVILCVCLSLFLCKRFIIMCSFDAIENSKSCRTPIANMNP